MDTQVFNSGFFVPTSAKGDFTPILCRFLELFISSEGPTHTLPQFQWKPFALARILLPDVLENKLMSWKWEGYEQHDNRLGVDYIRGSSQTKLLAEGGVQYRWLETRNCFGAREAGTNSGEAKSQASLAED